MLSRRTLLIACGTAALSLAGCGGNSKHSVHHRAAPTVAVTPTTAARGATSPIVPAKTFATKPGILGRAASAGTIASYVPTGSIIADSGFRPTANGFAFENYGNNAGPVNLKPVNIEDLFGPQVCAVGSGSTCVLTPSARAWEQQENVAMADGHCMGFSVTALRFFTGDLRPAAYGASSTPGLPIVGNDRLQSLIAEDFAYQSLPSVRQQAVIGTPDRVLSALIAALRARQQAYTLAILKADGTGGHAITPFAVEQRPGGLDEILVYDNNFPGVVRKVDVDTTADTWHYVGGINPSDTSEIYDGNAQTQSMALFPTSPGEATQPCPFCSTRAGTNPNPGTVVPSKKSFVEVSVQAKGPQHPHLLFVDPRTGAKTGFVGSRLVQQIPGILVNANYSVRNWTSAPEPTYDLPLGHPLYEILVDGSKLTHQTVVKITVNGDGVLFTISAINMEPGQQDRMLLPANNLQVAYVSNAPFHFSPLLNAEFVTYSSNKSQPRFVQVDSALLGYKPGAPYTMLIVPGRNAIVVGSPIGGVVPARSSASAYLRVASAPLRGGERAHTYTTSSLRFDPNTEVAQLPYYDPRRRTLPVLIVNRRTNRVTQTVQVPQRGRVL